MTRRGGRGIVGPVSSCDARQGSAPVSSSTLAGAFSCVFGIPRTWPKRRIPLAFMWVGWVKIGRRNEKAAGSLPRLPNGQAYLATRISISTCTSRCQSDFSFPSTLAVGYTPSWERQKQEVCVKTRSAPEPPGRKTRTVVRRTQRALDMASTTPPRWGRG